MFQTYEEAVRWITSLTSFGMRPGLERMRLLMEKLDHPHQRLRFIHVAGTNGKGSTCAYLQEVLLASGYDVGMFTSPYLTTYADRIRYNGEAIPEASLIRITNQLKPLVDELAASEWGSPTMFEVSVTLAIQYYATEAFPDYVVWETGLGGRLDCTNIVHPVISIITNIGHDHMDLLGDSLEKVAAEKAGIIKPGVPVVTTVQQPELLEVIARKAEQNKSTVYRLGDEFTVEALSAKMNEQTFHFHGPFRSIDNVSISMNGSHQVNNAAAALMAIEVLRQYVALVVDDEELLNAFRSATWPGRLELASANPRILLDGAHNPEGAEALAKALQSIYPYRQLHVMIGMLQTKNHRGVLQHILPLVSTLVITEPDFMKRMESGKLAEIARELAAEQQRNVEVIVEPDWKRALEKMKRLTHDDDLAVVTGTLYLVADARSWILHQNDSEKGW